MIFILQIFFCAMVWRLVCIFFLHYLDVWFYQAAFRENLVPFSLAAIEEFHCIIYRFLSGFSRRCFILLLSRKYYTSRFRLWLKYGTWANWPSFNALPPLRLYYSYWNQKRTSGINSHIFKLLALGVWLLLFQLKKEGEWYRDSSNPCDWLRKTLL